MTLTTEQRRRWIAFVVVATLVVVVDQLTKLWVDANFAQAALHPAAGAAEPTPVIGDFVRIAKSYNSGGIFGLFGNSAAILALASTIVLVLIVVYEAREGSRSWPLTIALALLLGGAVGNFIDRVLHGYVVDFVDMGIGDSRFYTFNVADSAISTALVLLVLIALFGERLTGRLAHEPG